MNKKISALDPLGTTPAVGDIIPITDISGTPTTKSVTVANLMLAAPVQTNDISDLATQVSLGSTESSLTALINLRATQVSLGNHEALTSLVHGISAFGATLVDDASASTARTTLELGTAATTDASDYATAAQGTLADSALQPTSVINDLSDVTITSASNEDVIKFNGTSFVNGQVSVDVNTPLTTALRGTDNPHIGAYPDQSFKVTDNPQKSVMVIADADGNLDFLVKSDSANIYLNTPSARKAASFGFSVVEDSTEPDIEVVGTLAGASENYSVISGDSDSLGANGLPIRQGFNLPDIGANPAPILISGGSIA